MIASSTKICVSRRETQAFTRESSHAANAHSFAYPLNSLLRPQSCSRGHRRQTAGWQMSGSPKAPDNSFWQGKPACWGRPGVQPRLPGPPVTPREM